MHPITKLGILMFFGGGIALITIILTLITMAALTAPFPSNLMSIAALITFIGMMILTIMDVIDPFNG